MQLLLYNCTSMRLLNEQHEGGLACWWIVYTFKMCYAFDFLLHEEFDRWLNLHQGNMLILNLSRDTTVARDFFKPPCMPNFKKQNETKQPSVEMFAFGSRDVLHKLTNGFYCTNQFLGQEKPPPSGLLLQFHRESYQQGEFSPLLFKKHLLGGMLALCPVARASVHLVALPGPSSVCGSAWREQDGDNQKVPVIFWKKIWNQESIHQSPTSLLWNCCSDCSFGLFSQGFTSG